MGLHETGFPIPEIRNDRFQPFSLRRIYDAPGLIRQDAPNYLPPDISVDLIMEKVTNPKIALDLGATPVTVAAIKGIEIAANLVDSWSETGVVGYIDQADVVFAQAILSLPEDVAETVRRCTKAAMTYFYYEAYVSQRIKRGEQFTLYEAAHYLLSRGADSIIYREVLRADGIDYPGLTAAFRTRQALWDLEDDAKDLDQDHMSTGANVLLMSTRGKRRNVQQLARALWTQSRDLVVPTTMKRAINEQYQSTLSALG